MYLPFRAPSFGSASLHRESPTGPRILITKLTSLGDVVKTLPVVEDIRAAIPDARIDWVVERPVDALLELHPGIERVIPLELRRYRKERRYAAGLGAIIRDMSGLRAQRYDLVVDLQGRMKSALTAGFARGPVVGPAPGPRSEPHYHRLYRSCIPVGVSAGMNAIERNRALCAAALGYPLPRTAPDFGLRADDLPASSMVPSCGFALLAHGSSSAGKCWPERHWIELGRELERHGLCCLLPWGSIDENGRAHRIAAQIGNALVLERSVTLPELMTLLSQAMVVIGTDSGLVHLAAACGAPTAAIFVATDPGVFGIRARTPYRNLGAPGLPPLPMQVLGEVEALLAEAPSHERRRQHPDIDSSLCGTMSCLSTV